MHEQHPREQRASSARLRRIDRPQATAVAQAFLDAPRGGLDPMVRAAYTELGRQADRWFQRLTGADAARPIRVVFTRCAEPYSSGQELSSRVRAERVLELRPAHYDSERLHPVLDSDVGGTYDRLRAVHDLISHACFGFGFDRHGEFSAWLAEDRLYHGSARWALATELHAEHSVLWTTGQPAEHKATLLPCALLRASKRCAARRCDGSAPAA